MTRFAVRWHARQYGALRALGEPPEARLAYGRWLATVAARVRLEARYAPLLRAARAGEAQALAAQVAGLKLRGDAMARLFGLRVCAAGALSPAPPAA